MKKTQKSQKKGKKKGPSAHPAERGSLGMKMTVKEAQAKAKEYLEGWKRAKADHINYRKKTENQKEELVKYCNEDLILKILPVIDAFDLALEHVPKKHKTDDWVVGIVAIEDMLLKVLKENDVEEVETEGQKFDPEFHEAVEHVKDKDFKTGEIVEELARGFKLNGRVIRAAKVKVAR